MKENHSVEITAMNDKFVKERTTLEEKLSTTKKNKK